MMDWLGDAGIRERLSRTSGEEKVRAAGVNGLEFFGQGAGSKSSPARPFHVRSQAGGNDGAWIGRPGRTKKSAA